MGSNYLCYISVFINNILKFVQHNFIMRAQKMDEEFTSVTVVTGPMFAGKTTELIRVIRQFDRDHPDLNKIVIKPISDDRYDANQLVSHNGEKYPAVNLSKLMDIIPVLKTMGLNGVRHIFIDEGHFSPDIPEFLSHKELEMRAVTISGLDFDYMRKWFEGMENAVNAHAKRVITLRADCTKCKSPSAKYTARYDDDSDERLKVGGANTYYACCENCHPIKEEPPLDAMISIVAGATSGNQDINKSYIL